VEERLIELGDFIRSQREVARISVRRLAELADVSNPYLSQIERGLRKPSADILQQIAKALQISAESLYVRAGILEPDQDVVVSVVDAVHRDPYLSGEQKQTLLRVYESLRAQAAESGSSTEPAGA
jgi:transcriptional regulator with XRE-family HTH domain